MSYSSRTSCTLLGKVTPMTLVSLQWTLLEVRTRSQYLDVWSWLNTIKHCFQLCRCFHSDEQRTSTTYKVEAPTVTILC